MMIDDDDHTTIKFLFNSDTTHRNTINSVFHVSSASDHCWQTTLY